MSCHYPECRDCYFSMRAPQVCEECHLGDQYEPNDGEANLMKLRAVRFQEISFTSADEEQQ